MNDYKTITKFKSVKVFIAIIIGFSLSYIPNNYMDERSENIALIIVIAITVIGILWSLISNKKTDLKERQSK